MPNELALRPLASTSSSETHAALVVSNQSVSGSFSFSGRIKTVDQTRENAAPNSWETAWIVWGYQDNSHFYYFTLKTNGWEIGKADPAYPGGQRFLATGSSPAVDIGSWHDFNIQTNGSTFTVTVDGKVVATFTDQERPYTSGKLGFYTEDADIRVDNISGPISDSFDSYATGARAEGQAIGPWTVAFNGFGSVEIVTSPGSGTSEPAAGGGTAPVNDAPTTGTGATGTTIVGSEGADTVNASATVPGQPLPTSGNDTIDGRQGDDTLFGLAGDDTIRGGAHNDVLHGGDGNDVLIGGVGVDHLYGGNGDDTFIVSGADDQFDLFNGGAGTDRVQISGTVAASLTRFVATESSVETLQGNGQAILGTAGYDVFDFSGLTAMTNVAWIDGGAGIDRITGSRFNDDLRGGGDFDRIVGGAGDDRLTGGSGGDTFAFASGHGRDTITDFSLSGSDVVEFSRDVYANFAQLMAKAQQVGTDVVITTGAAETLTIKNVSLNSLNTDDFRFV